MQFEELRGPQPPAAEARCRSRKLTRGSPQATARKLSHYDVCGSLSHSVRRRPTAADYFALLPPSANSIKHRDNATLRVVRAAACGGRRRTKSELRASAGQRLRPAQSWRTAFLRAPVGEQRIAGCGPNTTRIPADPQSPTRSRNGHKKQIKTVIFRPYFSLTRALYAKIRARLLRIEKLFVTL